jgi:hypothetical protein
MREFLEAIYDYPWVAFLVWLGAMYLLAVIRKD